MVIYYIKHSTQHTKPFYFVNLLSTLFVCNSKAYSLLNRNANIYILVSQIYFPLNIMRILSVEDEPYGLISRIDSNQWMMCTDRIWVSVSKCETDRFFVIKQFILLCNGSRLVAQLNPSSKAKARILRDYVGISYRIKYADLFSPFILGPKISIQSII